MYCSRCGAQINEGNSYCPKCGNYVAEKPTQTYYYQSEGVSDKSAETNNGMPTAFTVFGIAGAALSLSFVVTLLAAVFGVKNAGFVSYGLISFGSILVGVGLYGIAVYKLGRKPLGLIMLVFTVINAFTSVAMTYCVINLSSVSYSVLGAVSTVNTILGWASAVFKIMILAKLWRAQVSGAVKTLSLLNIALLLISRLYVYIAPANNMELFGILSSAVSWGRAVCTILLFVMLAAWDKKQKLSYYE